MSIRHTGHDLPPMSTPYSVLLEPRKDNLNTNLVAKLAKIMNENITKPIPKEQMLPSAATSKEIELATTNAICQEPTIPEDIPIKERIGKIGLMWPQKHAMTHHATPLL